MSDPTDKQKVFIEEYLTCWNATEAARRAGYAHPNKDGPRLLVNVGISAAIDSRLSEKAMTADEVIARLAEHARGSMVDFVKVDTENKFDGFDLSKDAPLHLVKKLSITKNGISFELYDAQSALLNLGKMHGLFREQGDDNEEEYTEEELRTLIERVLPAKRSKGTRQRSSTNTDS